MEEIERAFEAFWQAGMRKIGKKAARAAFISAFKQQKEHKEPALFAHMLAEDVRQRLRGCQLGFDLMHPTTYLRGERWTDEKPAVAQCSHRNYDEAQRSEPNYTVKERDYRRVDSAIASKLIERVRRGICKGA